MTQVSSLRVLPTNDTAYKKGWESFDRFQVSHVDIGVPLAILHGTSDGKWLYAKAGSMSGWVAAQDVALGSKRETQQYAFARPLVILGNSVPFYYDRDCRNYALKLDMGSRVPLVGNNAGSWEVLLPGRGQDGSVYFIAGFTGAASDVHDGYLEYSLENLISQAFKMKGLPYVWGGKLEGSENCSSFVMSVFNCFGFQIPRSSSDQGKINLQKKIDLQGLTKESRLDILRRVDGHPALLHLSGHIMIYLGTVGDRAYAIHSMWSYREKQGLRERVRLVKKITVSDLSIGEETSDGSYLQKISSVILMD